MNRQETSTKTKKRKRFRMKYPARVDMPYSK